MADLKDQFQELSDKFYDVQLSDEEIAYLLEQLRSVEAGESSEVELREAKYFLTPDGAKRVREAVENHVALATEAWSQSDFSAFPSKAPSKFHNP